MIVAHSYFRADKGTSLQGYNNELVKCLDDLRGKREEVAKQIVKEEEIKAKIQNDLRVLTERLARVNESLARKIASRNEYDRTIVETEKAYKQVGILGVHRVLSDICS